MMTRCRQTRLRSALLPFSAMFIAAALLSTGCTSSTQLGKVVVRSDFGGNVPGHGATMPLGAINTSGQTVASRGARSAIRPLGQATLTLPAGNYRIAVWLPGSTRFTRALALCSVPATAVAGQTITVNLTCIWH